MLVSGALGLMASLVVRLDEMDEHGGGRSGLSICGPEAWWAHSLVPSLKFLPVANMAVTSPLMTFPSFDSFLFDSQGRSICDANHERVATERIWDRPSHPAILTVSRTETSAKPTHEDG